MEFKRFNPAALSPEFMKNFASEHGNEKSIAKQFLLPGQFLVAKEPTLVSTILGSCVAVCLWDTRLAIGGINHFLLPEGESAVNSMRYGNVANQTLLVKLVALGCSPQSLQGKIFGGSHTFSAGNHESSLGTRNVQAALDFLRKAGIPIITKDISGKSGRKVLFNTGDGSAIVKLLTTGANADEGTVQQ